MLAGQLELQLYANVARLIEDMAKMESAVSGSLGRLEKGAQVAMNALSALGVGLSAAAFAGMVKGALDAADALNKLQQRTGVATEFLSQLQYAAKLADVSNESLATSMRKLNVSIAQGLAGDKEKIAVFRQLGVTTADLGQGTEAVMMKMADAFAKAGDGAGKQAISLALMGKAGDDMIPLLNGGSAAIRDLMTEADRLGLTIGQDFAKKAEEFNDSITRVQASSGKLAIILAGELVEATGKAMKAFADASVEGGRLHGVIVGLNTLFYGDDRHQANVKIVDVTDQIIGTMNALDRARVRAAEARDVDRPKAEAEVTRLQKRLAFLQEEVRMHQRQAESLDKEKAAAEAAAVALEKIRQGNQLKVPGSPAAANKDLEEQARLLAELSGLSGNFAKDWDKLNVLYARGAINIDQLTAAQAKLLAQQPFFKENQKQIDEDSKRMLERWKDEERAVDDLFVSRDKLFQQAITNEKKADDLLKSIQLEADALTMTNAEREVAIALRQLEATGLDASKQKYKDLAVAITLAVEQREATRESIEMWRSIDRTAHDVFVNIFEDGAGTFKRLGQTLKASLLDLLYQMTVKRWVISIGASIGLPGAASAASALGGGSSMLGTIGNLSSLANFAGFGSGSSVFTQFATSGIGEALGLSTTVDAIGGIGTASTAMTGAGSMLAAAGPWVAAALAIAALAKNFKGETRSGGQYNFGDLISGPSGGEIGVGSQSAGSAASATAAMINATLAAIGSSSRLSNFMTGLETSEKGKGFAYAGGTLSTGGAFGQGWGAAFSQDGWNNRRGNMTAEQAVAAFSEELKQATLQAIQAATDVPEAIAKLVRDKDFDSMAAAELDTTLASVQAVINGVDQFRAAVQLLPFAHLRDLTFDLASALGDLSGGMDKFLANLSTYYANFFSETEQRQQLARNISAVLRAAGADFSEQQILGSSRAQFRQVVEAFQGRTDPAGQALYAALLQVAGAFAELYPVVDETTTAVEDAVQAITDLVGPALTALERVAAMERQAIDARRQAAQEQVDALAALVNITEAATRQLYGQVDATRAFFAARGRAQVAQMLATARTTGYMPAASELDRAVQAATAGIDRPGQSRLDADFERLVLAGQLAALEAIGKPQLSEAEQAVRLAQQQLEALDQQVDYWRQAIAIAQGQLDATLTWGGALQQMAAAFAVQFGRAPGAAPASAGGTGGGASFGGSSGAGGRMLVTSQGIPIDLAAYAMANLDDPAGIAAYTRRYGGTMADLAAAVGKPLADVETWFALQGVPSFRIGTPYVAADQLAYLHQGERVLTRAENQAQALGTRDAEVLAELRDMNQRLWRLEKQALRTANAVNGLGEAPMVVETT